MDLRSLLHSLDASINTASTVSVVLRDLGMVGSDGTPVYSLSSLCLLCVTFRH